MSIPNYRVVLRFDADRKVFEARAPELEHCHGEGPNRADAVARLEEEIRAQVDNMQAHGSKPPAPVDEVQPSGELRVKLSHSLHRELLWLARQEGVEVEHLLGELVSAGIEGRRGSRSRPAGRPAGAEGGNHDNIGHTMAGGGNRGGRGFGNRYNAGALDDRASFIEYVRNLEQGQQGGYGPGRGPGGGGGAGGGGGGPRNRRRSGPPGGGAGRGPGGGSGGSGGGGAGPAGGGSGRA